MSEKVAVIGAGAWGTTVALLLARKGWRVGLWASQSALAESMAITRQNDKYLPGVPIPAPVHISSDRRTIAEGAELVVWAIPVQFLRSRAREFAEDLAGKRIFVNLGKGIEEGTAARPSEILMEEYRGCRAVGSLVGPNIASEVAKGMYAEAILAMSDYRLLRETADCFSSESFRVTTSADLIGIELSSALKNVCSIMAGICDGLKAGANMKGIVIAITLEEVRQLADALGGNRESFLLSTTLGDVLASSYSPEGRNRRVGEYLGMGYDLEEAMRRLGGRIAEGVATCRACDELREDLGLKLPVIQAVRMILDGKLQPEQGLRRILACKVEKATLLDSSIDSRDGFSQQALQEMV